MATLLGIAIALMPFVAVIGLLRLADHVVRRRAARYVRQIQLTDAIHRELGAAVAPTVRRRLRGEWLVTMQVPLDRPGTVAALIGITERMFASTGGAAGARFRIVLKPDRPSPAPA